MSNFIRVTFELSLNCCSIILIIKHNLFIVIIVTIIGNFTIVNLLFRAFSVVQIRIIRLIHGLLFLSCAIMSLVRFLLRLILADLYLDSFLLFFWRCTCINSRLRSRLRQLWCLSLIDIYRLLLFHLYIIISLYSRLNL